MSKQSAFGERCECVLGEQDMVINRDAYDLARLDDLPGNIEVFPGRLRIAAGVVVSYDDTGACSDDGTSEDLARMNQACGQCALCDDLESGNAIGS